MHIEHRPITGREQEAEAGTPLAALRHFYRGFNGRDLSTVADNWSHADEVTMDNPLGGIKRGWEEIGAVYRRLFEGPARVYVEFYDYSLIVSGDMFCAVGRERGELVLDGQRLSLAIRTSRIYRHIDGRWRQVHHHGSMDDPELLAAYQGAVPGTA
jgi:ketosteroid isomerase-like protein